MLLIHFVRYKCFSLCLDVRHVKRVFLIPNCQLLQIQANSRITSLGDKCLRSSSQSCLFLSWCRQICTSHISYQSDGIASKKKVRLKSLIRKYDAIPPDIKGENSPILHHAKRGLFGVLPSGIYKVTSSINHDNSSWRFSNSRDDLFLLHQARKNILNSKEDIEYRQESKEEHVAIKPVIIDTHLNELEWRKQEICISKLPTYYASLAKSRLTGLVVLTCMAGYVIAPAPFVPLDFLLCSLGTALVSSSANSINQFFEIPFDSQMDRTKNRVLVRGSLTPLHSVIFALTCGVSGLSILYIGVNGLTSALGLANLMLYTSIYTPMKRISILNTWIGSVVGAIPPLMGWAACTGNLNTGALVLGGILYAWQFPHFNALSWNLRQDYSRAGYVMMSVCDPGLCKRTALRYCAVILLLSTLSPVCGITSWTFAIDSLPFNLYFIFLAWKFYREGDSKSSRKLFRFSLIHLPIIMALMIISSNRGPSETSSSSKILQEKENETK